MRRFCISLRETFPTIIVFTGINEYGKSAAIQLSTVFRAVYHVTCWVLWNETSYWFIWPRFWKLVSSKIHLLWGSSFFGKCWKSNLNFENSKKKSQIIFRFLDNCIWKCCHRLCLIRKEYLLSALNRLKSSLKIFHITERNLLTLNCIHRDQ